MANKHWATDSNGNHVLYFTPYYDEEQIATLFYDDDGELCYSSALLHADNEFLDSDTLEDAKKDIESLIIDYYDDQLAYYDDLKRKFEEDEAE